MAHLLMSALAVLRHIKRVLPRLATDRSLFPNPDEARDWFGALGMKEVVRAIDADAEERRRNEEIAKIWNEKTI